MAPKPSLEGLSKAIQELGRHVHALQPGKGGGGGSRKGDAKLSGKWDCPHCQRGLANFGDRTSCYRCHRDRVTGALDRSDTVEGRGDRGGRATSVKARRQASLPPAGSQGVQEEEEPEDGDPIATELGAARSYLDWVRKLKPGGARAKELAAAQKRLAEAELADKRRKPPAERLQSALSRVDHWQKQRAAAVAERDAAKAALGAAEAGVAAIDARLEEAHRELAISQSMHAAWGQERGGEGPPYAAQPGDPTPQQQLIINRICADLQTGAPLGIHVMELMGTMGYRAGMQQGPAPAGDPAMATAAPPLQAHMESKSAARNPRTTGRPDKKGRAPVEQEVDPARSPRSRSRGRAGDDATQGAASSGGPAQEGHGPMDEDA